jgi:RNA recognition motif. (a.k.a. RRM, RBD, or RNP domain)
LAERSFTALWPQLITSQLRLALTDSYKLDTLVNVRIIRERGSEASKGYGFITFADKPSAVMFMDKHYPEIELGRRRVTIAYVEERGAINI